jgi:UDP-glucose 4-epimerase
MAGNTQSDVLILGGNGFIGTALSDRLRGEGRLVTVLDPMPPRDPSHREYWIPGKLEDIQLCDKVLRPGMAVVHLAWSSLPEPSNRDPYGDLASNLLPTVRWLEACAEAKVAKVVFISSGGTVYGIPRGMPIREDHITDPICSYGIGKLAVEKYLSLYHHLRGLPFFVLRGSNVYGPGKDPFGKQGAINVFLGALARKETIHLWGDGKVVRDYLYISDLVDLIVRCLDGGSPDGPHIHNAGSGMGHSLREVLKEIQDVTGEEPRVAWSEGRKVDVPTNVLDITRARSEFGWSPRVTLRDGIRKTWEWIRGSGYAR